MYRAALLIALVACKKAEEPAPSPTAGSGSTADVEAMLVTLTDFADAMCRCSTPSCAENVDRESSQWSARKKHGGTPTPAQRQRISAQMTRYAQCRTKAALAPSPPDAAVDHGPEPVKPPATAGALMISASAFAKADRVRSAKYAYIGADGVLDPEFGAFEVRFGLAPVDVDDPNRRTGAPRRAPKDRPTYCEQFAWTPAGGWAGRMLSCGDVAVVGPRCAATEIWKRAIERNAPADALAVLDYQTSNGKGAWSFRISDPPRGVNVQLGFRDDCELNVESPTPSLTPF